MMQRWLLGGSSHVLLLRASLPTPHPTLLPAPVPR